METLEDLITQLSGYVGKLQVERTRLKPEDSHYKEIAAALQEVRDNLEWCLTLKPELDEQGYLKRK